MPTVAVWSERSWISGDELEHAVNAIAIAIPRTSIPSLYHRHSRDYGVRFITVPSLYSRRMAQEIERKYLVDVARWKPSDAGELLVQGYLSSVAERTVRARIAGDHATLTIKGLTKGVTRAEFEYAIPVADATIILRDLCERPLIEKRRHRELVAGKTWEVDVFAGDNLGLVVAELELASEAETFELPPWVLDEVSHDPRYYNANLLKAPYTTWGPRSS